MENQKISINFKDNTISITKIKKYEGCNNNFFFTIESDGIGSSFITKEKDGLHLINQYIKDKEIRIVENIIISEKKAREIIKECILNPIY